MARIDIKPLLYRSYFLILIGIVTLKSTNCGSITIVETASATESTATSKNATDNTEDLLKYENFWDGNHLKAKSESWTWMGHLKELEETGDHLKFKNDGVAFIHYYTRNQSKMGSLTFKTSALTPTINDVGQSYLKQTHYSSLAKDFYVKLNTKQLGIEWHYNNEMDSVTWEPLQTETDLRMIDEKLLPLFVNLQRDKSMMPVKSRLNAKVGENSHFALTMYSIWQPLAPTADGRIRFLGVDGTFTFFHPMILAIGSWTHNGITKKVCGMVTLDRQWSNEYFGKSLADKPTDYLKVYRALSYAHHWSGFHGYLPESKSWIFVHLWNQFYRKSNEQDLEVPYANMVWVKNAIPQLPLTPTDYTWQGQSFVLDNSKVLLNYGEGRERYFPSQFNLNSQSQNIELAIRASPTLQSLEQPIYLFEGFGTGEGFWQGEPISVQGRIESSRLLFRDQDYLEMIETIRASPQPSAAQDALQTHLEELLRQDENCRFLYCHDRAKKHYKRKTDYFKFVGNDMNLKMSILRAKLTHKESKVDPTNPNVMIYY
jgi:hypothetical protein